MLQITSIELKQNFDEYLSIIDKEEIIITRHGVPVAKLSLLKEKEIHLVSQLIGVIPNIDYKIEDARKQRLIEDKSNH